MSGAGQLAGGLLGAWVGSFFGMPGLGFSIGSALFASPLKGPSVDPGDLTFNTSAYGKFMRWGYGTFRVDAPVAFWSTDYVAHKHTEGGGKGGGGVEYEYYTYTRSCAYHLCDCSSGNPITGIRRIWDLVTGELVWTAANDATAGDIVASDKLADSVTVYTGSSGQSPDPLIEAHEGWAPAWPGRAYVVVENLQHGQSKSPRLLGFEVFFGSLGGLAELAINTDIDIYKYVGGIRYNNGTVLVYPHSAGASDIVVTATRFDVDCNKIIDEQYNLKRPASYSYYIRWLGDWNEVPVFMDNTGEIGDVYVGDDIWYYGSDGAMASVSADGKYLAVILAYGTGLRIYDEQQNIIFDNESVQLYQIPGVHPEGCAFERDYIWTITYNSGITTTYLYEIDYSAQDITLVGSVSSTVVGRVGVASGVAADGIVVWVITNSLIFSTHTLYTVTRKELATTTSVSLPDVVGDICDRAGLAASEYDTSLLPATAVRYAVATQRPARDWLADLGAVYQFRMRDSGGKIQFVPKGQASAVTIPDTALGMEPGTGTVSAPIATSRSQGIDLPRSVTVIHPDADRDYQAGQQQYLMRQYSQGQDITIRTTAILTADEALELATITCIEPHLERHTWETSLGVAYAGIEAADVITTSYGTAWVRSVKEEGDGILRVSLQQEASTAYSGQGLPAPGPKYTPRTVSLAGPTLLQIIDAPALTSGHTGAGYLVAACGYLSGWNGCNVLMSRDGGETYDLMTTIGEAATIGHTEDSLGAPASPWMWDRTNTITVQLVSGSLASITEQAAREGGNALMVGDEVICAADVTYLGNDRYTLSTLLRGRRGTEWACDDHSSAERVVLLDTKVQRIQIDDDQIGVARLFKAVSFGSDVTSASEHSFTPAGVSLEPWAAGRVRGSRNASGDLTIKWHRRGRFPARPFWSPPMSDTPESYEVDIMSGSTVLRTLTSSSQTASYTAAQQTIDGVTLHTPVTVRVYQINATVGRGYVSEATI